MTFTHKYIFLPYLEKFENCELLFPLRNIGWHWTGAMCWAGTLQVSTCHHSMLSPDTSSLLYVIFLLLIQITTNLVAENNTNLLSHGSRGQKSKMGLTRLKTRCQRLYSFLKAVEKNLVFLSFPASTVFLHSLATVHPPSSKPAMAF